MRPPSAARSRASWSWVPSETIGYRPSRFNLASSLRGRCFGSVREQVDAYLGIGADLPGDASGELAHAAELPLPEGEVEGGEVPLQGGGVEGLPARGLR